MIVISADKTIAVTRGDSALFTVSANIDDERHTFSAGDTVRLKVFEKKNVNNVVLQKDFALPTASEDVTITLSSKDTKIGEPINKPVEYWYEVELNPYTDPQTIIGYDDDGAKIFKLYPEGADIEPEEPTEEEKTIFTQIFERLSNIEKQLNIGGE